MNIKEVREKFPQYNDLSDTQLADALHAKFYSDIPKPAFYSRIGLTTGKAAPTPEPAADADYSSADPFMTAIATAAAPEPKVRPTSVLEGVKAPAPLPTEDPMLRPEFVRGVERRIGALPAEQRAEALSKLAQRKDVYGRAARVVQGRTAAMEKAGEVSPAVAGVTDPRLETQVRKLIDEGGMAPDAAEAYARQELEQGRIPRVLPKMRAPTGAELALEQQAREYEVDKSATGIEAAIKSVQRLGKTGELALGRAGGGMQLFIGEMLGADVSDVKDKLNYISAYAREMGENPYLPLQVIESAGSSIVQQLPALVAGAITGSGGLALTSMYANSFGDTYADGRNRGLDKSDSTARAAIYAAFEVLGERFGLKESIGGLKAAANRKALDEIIPFFSSQLKKNIAGEELTYAGQFATDKGFGLNPEAGFADFLKGAAETALVAATQTGMMLGGAAATSKTLRTLDKSMANYALAKEISKKDFEQAAIDEYARRALSPEFYSERTVVPGVPTERAAPEAQPPAPPAQPPVAAPTAERVEPTFDAEAAAAVAAQMPAGRAEPTLEAPAPTEETRLSVERLMALGLDPEDAQALVEREAVARAEKPAAPVSTARLEDLTDEYIAAGLPPEQARALAIKRVQQEEEADKAAEGEARATKPVSAPSGEGAGVAGVSGERPAAGRPARAKRTGVVSPAEDVGQPAVGEGEQPGAVSGLYERLGLPQGPARENARHEDISLDDAILLKKMIVKTVENGLASGKTRQQIAQQLETLTKGGISPKDFNRIHDYLTERGVNEESASEPAAPAAPKTNEEILAAATDAELAKALTTYGGSEVGRLSPDLIQGEIAKREAAAKAATTAPAVAPVAETTNLRELNKSVKKLYEGGEEMSVDDLRLTKRKMVEDINDGLATGKSNDEIVAQLQKTARGSLTDKDVAAVQTLLNDKRGVAAKAPPVPKQPELAEDTPPQLNEVAKGKKRVPPAKVVTAAPGDIPPPSVGKPRGRPAKPTTPETEEAAAKAKREQTLAANQAARDVAAAEKKLLGSFAPIPKNAPQMARKNAEAARQEAINTLYALSRRNRNKPGQRATEALKNPKISQAELDKAKAEYAAAKNVSIESLLPAKEEIKARPSANVERLTKMLGSKLYGSPKDIALVSVKELFQNSFDAIKESIEKGQLTKGTIKVKLDDATRTVTIIDNGPGMPTSVMGNQFLQIAGTVKGTSRASGGLGVAKMLFLFENKQLEVVSLRDGVVSRMTTTGDDLKESMSDPSRGPVIQTSTDPGVVKQYKKLFPEGHGTLISVQVPETYVDPSTGETKDIDFGTWELAGAPVLRFSPLFEPIEVLVDKYNLDSYQPLPIGDNFPVNEFTPFSNVNFEWGTARIYISKDEPSNRWDKNTHILSNGLWQFSTDLKDKPGFDGKKLKRTFYLDLSPKPTVKPEDPGYPFDLNRQRFSPTAKGDIDKIFNYIQAVFGQQAFAAEVKNFGTVQYFDPDGSLTAPETLEPKAPATPTALTLIRPDDQVEVREGVLYVNNRALPDITPQDLEKSAIRIDELTIPQDKIDPDRVMVHDNVYIKGDPDQTPISDVARALFGKQYDSYIKGVGDIFMKLRSGLVRSDPSRYDNLAKEAIGVSIDKEYYGVSTRIPFAGMFINPASTRRSSTPEQVATSLLLTMQHELAHFKERNHGAEFVSELQDIINALDNSTDIKMAGLKDRMIKHVRDHWSVFEFLNKEFKDGNLEPRGNRFQDASHEQIPDGGDAGSGAGPSGAGKRRPRVSEGAEKGPEPARQVSVPAAVSGAPAPSGAVTPSDTRTVAQIDKEVNKAIDGFEKSATATDLADNVSLAQSLRDFDKFKSYFKGLYDKLDGARLSSVLFFMTNDTVAEWGGSYVPELKNTNKLLRQMRTMSRNLLEGAQRVSEEVQRAIAEDPSLKRKLERITSVATDVRVDPARDRRSAKLNEYYNGLGVKGQALYRKLRDYYADVLSTYELLLDSQIDEANLPPGGKQVLMAEIKKMYEADKKIVPFFPFVRNRGPMWLQVGKGQGRQFYTFANEAERQTVMDYIAKEMKSTTKELLADQVFVKGDTLESFRKATSDMTQSLKKVFDKIDDSVDPKEIVGRVAALTNVFKKQDPSLTDEQARAQAYEQARDEATRDVKNTIYEMYLLTLPDQNFRRGFIARKDIPGYNVDLIRNFSTYAVKTSSQLPRVKYGPKLRNSLRASEKSLDGDPDASKKMRFVNEMTRRVDLELNPYAEPAPGMSPTLAKKIDQAVDFATRAAFVHYLSAGASAIIQGTGFLYGLSTLGARYGYARTAAELAKMTPIWNEFGVSRTNDDGSVTFQVPSIINSKSVTTSPMEKRFVRDMMGAGIGEYTLTSEMLNRGRVSTAAFEGRGSKLGRGTMMVLGGPFQTIERLVQETLAIMAFRLGTAEAKRKGLAGEELYQAATDKALTAVYDSVGNMAESNRPPILRNAAGRFLMQFMLQPMFITTRWMREAYRTVTATGGAAKYQAFKELSGIMGVTWMLAGVAGLPFFSTILGYIGAWLEDEDEKMGRKTFKDLDYWTWWRTVWLPEYMGKVGVYGKPLTDVVGMNEKQLAALFERGPANMLTGVDISSRTSINPTDMFSGQNKEVRTTKEGALQFAEDRAGPFVSMVLSYMDAYDAFADGDMQRGMEKMLPAIARNPAIALKYYNEGIKDFRGSTILSKDSMTTGRILYQAIGFRIDEVSNQQKFNFAVSKIENKIRFEREDILKNLRDSHIKKDFGRYRDWMDKARKFNAHYPSYAIDDDAIVRSLEGGYERKGSAVRGFVPTEQNMPLFRDAVLKRAEAMREVEERTKK